jgi:hypothetical protein
LTTPLQRQRVLVSQVLVEEEAALLHGDLVGVLGQLAHLLERPIARRTLPLVVGEPMVDLAFGQPRLRSGSVPALRLLARLVRRARGLGAARRGAEDLSPQPGELLALPGYLMLELLRGQLPQPGDLLRHLRVALLEELQLKRQVSGVQLQRPEVLDLLDRVHLPSMIPSRANYKIFFTQRCWRERHLADEVAPLQEQLELGAGQRQTRRRRVVPQRREPTSRQPLDVEAEPGTIEVQHLRRRPPPIREQVQRPRTAGPGPAPPVPAR